MTYPSNPKRSPRVAILCLATLLLLPALARAQLGAGALTGTNTYEGREEGETIPIDLTTGSFGVTLPFDVTFKVSGDMPARFGRGSRVDARFVEFKRPPDCGSFFNQYTLTRQTLSDLNETDAIPVRRRQQSVAIETSGFRQATIFDASGTTLQAGMVPIGGGQGEESPPAAQGASFLVDFPALRPNHYYCFQFISRRALSEEDLEALHQAFESAVDGELRKDKYHSRFDVESGEFTTFPVTVEEYESMRVTLSATIEEQLANEDQVVLAPPNSFFNVGARLEDITLEYREQFEDIAETTVGGRLVAINAFDQKVAEAVSLLRQMADREFKVKVDSDDGGALEGTLTGRQLVMTSENPEVRGLGSELLNLSDEQLEDRFKGVPAGMALPPDLADTWAIDDPADDAAVLSIQERIDNIQQLSTFLGTLASAAAARGLDLSGAQVDVEPLTQADVDEAQGGLDRLNTILAALTADLEEGAEEPQNVKDLRAQITIQEELVANRQSSVNTGDVVPQVSMLEQATELLTDAVTQLGLLQELLQDRSGLIADWVRQVLVEEQASLVVGATTVADYDTRAIWYMSADIGSGISELEDFFTYVGWNIYLRPVNKKAHLSWAARPFGLGEEFMRRFSFTLGVVQTGFDERDGQYQGVIGGNAAVLGAGMRINDSLRFSLGGLLFESQDPDPLVDSSKLEWSPYVAISLDWNIGASFSGLLGGGG